MPRPSLQQRLFARFMAASDEMSYTLSRDIKEIIFAGIAGDILEIGPGTGVNFRFLDPSVTWTGVEPNPAMHSHLQKKALEYGIEANLVPGLSATHGLANSSFDCVVSTLVMCSVPDVDAILGDILRLLKTGGRYIFLEHVLDSDSGVRRRIQNAMPHTPWRYFSDGCYPNRDIGASIRTAGFSEVEINAYHQKGGGLVGAIVRPHIYGYAVK